MRARPWTNVDEEWKKMARKRQKSDDEINGDRIVSWIFLYMLIFLGGLAWVAYISPLIRLEHFAYMFGVIGSLATALTLFWLVLERNQLQKEKTETERKRQAVGVSAWLTKRTFSHASHQIIILNNNSDAPIYRVVVPIVDARNKDAKGEETQEEFRPVIDAVPPGQTFCFAPKGYSGMGFHPSVEIAFSDANGNYWARRGDGRLEELTEDPFTNYQIPQPPIYEQIYEL